MDLNQLYFDHQLSLMRAKATSCGQTRLLHRSHACTIARRIARIHHASGASALRNWEAHYTSPDQPADVRNGWNRTCAQ